MWRVLGYCSSVFVDPLVFCIDCLLFCIKYSTGLLPKGNSWFRGAPSSGLQPALISVSKCHEAEWLVSPRDRTQHLCCAQHRAPLTQEHYLDAGAPNQRFRQTEQTASGGNDLQAARHAVTALEPKHRGSVFGGSDARGSASERWGRASHLPEGQYRTYP